MENALLIGLSRQMVLERQLDVTANNLANVNTNGFKSDHALFEEYLRSGAHEDNFVSRDRAVSFVQDRGSFRDDSQGAAQLTNNPLDVAVSGAGLFAVQTAAGAPIVFQPTNHDVNIAPDGTVTVLEGTSRQDSIRGKLRVVSFANAQQLLKEGGNLYAAAEGAAPQLDTKSTVEQGYIEKSNVNSVTEMSNMIAISRAYQSVANILQQQSDLHKNAIEKLADVPA